MAELTFKQKHDLTQKIWSLRNKMVDQLKEMELIHEKIFPSIDDGIKALHIVHRTWDSKEYNELEKLILKIRNRR